MRDELLGKIVNLTTGLRSLEGIYKSLQKSHEDEREITGAQLGRLRKSIDARAEVLNRNLKELGKLVHSLEFQLDKITSQFIHGVPEIPRKELIEFLNKVIQAAVPPLMVVEAENSTVPTPMPGANVPFTVNKESVDSTNNLAAQIEKQAREWLEKINPPRKIKRSYSKPEKGKK